VLKVRTLLLLLMLVCGFAFSQSNPPRDGKGKQGKQQTKQTQQAPAADQRGTEQLPVIVKVVPTQKSEAEAAQDARDRQEKAEAERTKAELDRKLVTFNGDLAYYTKILAWVAGFQFLALFGQVIFLRLAFQESRRAGDIARDAMVASNRAYVHHHGCRWISHTHVADGHVFWRIRPQWINSGNTPTRKLNVYVRYEFRDDPLPENFAFATEQDANPMPATIAPKGVIESAPFDIDGSDLVAVRNGVKHFYVWGIARYNDVFTGNPQYITKFCVVASNITGDPLQPWHDTTNPVGIMFLTHGSHNCADEDCER